MYIYVVVFTTSFNSNGLVQVPASTEYYLTIQHIFKSLEENVAIKLNGDLSNNHSVRVYPSVVGIAIIYSLLLQLLFNVGFQLGHRAVGASV